MIKRNSFRKSIFRFIKTQTTSNILGSRFVIWYYLNYFSIKCYSLTKLAKSATNTILGQTKTLCLHGLVTSDLKVRCQPPRLWCRLALGSVDHPYDVCRCVYVKYTLFFIRTSKFWLRRFQPQTVLKMFLFHTLKCSNVENTCTTFSSYRERKTFSAFFHTFIHCLDKLHCHTLSRQILAFFNCTN